jgi:soluble lytic murein transglycosylase-like protein
MKKHIRIAVLTAVSITLFHMIAVGYVKLIEASLRLIEREKNRIIYNLANSWGFEQKRPAAQPLSIPERAELAALRQGLNPALLKAVVHVESRNQEFALSPKGAIGPAQIMPENAKRCALKTAALLLDPQINIDCGARILREELDKYGDLVTALQVYNGGPKCINKCSESVSYSRSVLRRLARDIGEPRVLETITAADRRKLSEIINRKG